MNPSGAFRSSKDGELYCRNCGRSCDTVTEVDSNGQQAEVLVCDAGCFKEAFLHE